MERQYCAFIIGGKPSGIFSKIIFAKPAFDSYISGVKLDVLSLDGTTVYKKALTRDMTGLIRKQVEHQVGNLLRLSIPAVGNCVDTPLRIDFWGPGGRSFLQRVHHAGFDGSRANCIHPYAKLCHL